MKILIETINTASDDDLTGNLRINKGMIQVQTRTKGGSYSSSPDKLEWRDALDYELSVLVYLAPPMNVPAGVNIPDNLNMMHTRDIP